jgi:hypothetical protein
MKPITPFIILLNYTHCCVHACKQASHKENIKKLKKKRGRGGRCVEGGGKGVNLISQCFSQSLQSSFVIQLLETYIIVVGDMDAIDY